MCFLSGMVVQVIMFIRWFGIMMIFLGGLFLVNFWIVLFLVVIVLMIVWLVLVGMIMLLCILLLICSMSLILFCISVFLLICGYGVLSKLLYMLVQFSFVYSMCVMCGIIGYSMCSSSFRFLWCVLVLVFLVFFSVLSIFIVVEMMVLYWRCLQLQLVCLSMVYSL